MTSFMKGYCGICLNKELNWRNPWKMTAVWDQIKSINKLLYKFSKFKILSDASIQSAMLITTIHSFSVFVHMWHFLAFHSSQLLCVRYLLSKDTILDLMATVFNTDKNELADDEVNWKVHYKYWIFSLHHKLW